MGISAIGAFNNSYDNKIREIESGLQKLKMKGVDDAGINHNDKTVTSGDGKELITKKERDFFINMFPENFEQLSKHVLFNRNGRLQAYNVSKGSIIDGRV